MAPSSRAVPERGGSGGWSWPGKGGAPALGLPRSSAPLLLSGHAPLPGPSPLCSPQGDALHVSAFSAACRLPDAPVRLTGCVFYSPLPPWAGWADITHSAFWLGGMGRWLPTGSEHLYPLGQSDVGPGISLWRKADAVEKLSNQESFAVRWDCSPR